MVTEQIINRTNELGFEYLYGNESRRFGNMHIRYNKARILANKTKESSAWLDAIPCSFLGY